MHTLLPLISLVAFILIILAMALSPLTREQAEAINESQEQRDERA